MCVLIIKYRYLKGVGMIEVELVTSILRQLDSIRRRTRIESRVLTLVDHMRQVTRADRTLLHSWQTVFWNASSTSGTSRCDSACGTLSRDSSTSSRFSLTLANGSPYPFFTVVNMLSCLQLAQLALRDCPPELNSGVFYVYLFIVILNIFPCIGATSGT